MGRFVVGSHCSRRRNPGLQIEMKRSLYLNEETLEPHEQEIAKLHDQIQDLVDEFCCWYTEEVEGKECHMTDLSE
jgi:N-formylglutamate amidohydrolase